MRFRISKIDPLPMFHMKQEIQTKAQIYVYAYKAEEQSLKRNLGRKNNKSGVKIV